MPRSGLVTLVAVLLVLGPRARLLEGTPLPEWSQGERLVYVFSPDEPGQCLRVAQLCAWADGRGGAVRFIGVVRPGGTGALAQDCRPQGGGVPVVAATELAAAGLPVDLFDRAPRESDCALLLDADGGVVWAASGAELLGAGRPALTTDIDESTWGKIKELFR